MSVSGAPGLSISKAFVVVNTLSAGLNLKMAMTILPCVKDTGRGPGLRGQGAIVNRLGNRKVMKGFWVCEATAWP
jgi:hypothetical protein